MFFHYNLNEKSYLAPITFGRPDPIEDFSTKLKTSGIQNDYKMGKQLEAKMRTFAVIVVRGEESEGPRFWGFGKTVYEELMGVMVDPDYGDITDLVNGRDVTVNFKTAKETGKSFPSTAIRVKPNQTPASEDRALLDSFIENQTRVTELYPELSYDELAEILNDWLKLGSSEEDASNPVTESELTSAASSTEDLDEFFGKDAK